MLLGRRVLEYGWWVMDSGCWLLGSGFWHLGGGTPGLADLIVGRSMLELGVLGFGVLYVDAVFQMQEAG